MDVASNFLSIAICLTLSPNRFLGVIYKVRHTIWVQNINCHQCRITDCKGRASKERAESASELKKKSFGGEEFSVVQHIQYECLSNGFYNGCISLSYKEMTVVSPLLPIMWHPKHIGRNVAKGVTVH
jgi:hypothetical protein